MNCFVISTSCLIKIQNKTFFQVLFEYNASCNSDIWTPPQKNNPGLLGRARHQIWSNQFSTLVPIQLNNPIYYDNQLNMVITLLAYS